MEALFGIEFSLPVKFFLAFAIVLILIGGTAYIVRRFATGGRESAVQRGRQPRLAVVDAAPIDARRRLVIVRRDNVEHLLLVGGPTDVLVEANIIRAQPTRDAIPTRDAGLARPAEPPSIVAEPAPRPAELPRPAAVAEPAPWPIQPPQLPEPPSRPAVAAAAPVEAPTYAIPVAPPIPVMPAPAARPPAPPAPMSALRAATEEIFSAPPVVAAPIAPVLESIATARPVLVDVAHIARIEPRPEPARVEPIRPEVVRVEPIRVEATNVEPIRADIPRIEPVRAEAARVEPIRHEQHLTGLAAAIGEPPEAAGRLQPAALAQPNRPTYNDDETIADMAQRLEAALRRPSMAVNNVPAQQARVAARAVPLAAVPTPARGGRPDAQRPAGPQQPGDALNYENLQREMASLLGRPNGSS
jgi:flagellar biogenesis protein FliO